MTPACPGRHFARAWTYCLFMTATAAMEQTAARAPARCCALLRYQPGAKIPRHLHVGVEFLLILRGSQRDERGDYQAGTFLVNPASSSHAIESDAGCIVLAIWERPVKFIASAP